MFNHSIQTKFALGQRIYFKPRKSKDEIMCGIISRIDAQIYPNIVIYVYIIHEEKTLKYQRILEIDAFESKEEAKKGS